MHRKTGREIQNCSILIARKTYSTYILNSRALRPGENQQNHFANSVTAVNCKFRTVLEGSSSILLVPLVPV
jgi:hypothetical protein